MTRGQHRDAFVVEAASGRRFDLALERFLEGRPFEFREISFAMAADGTVLVGVDTSWSAENVTLERATADLALAQAALHELVSTSSAFASAVGGHPILFELVEDYGNGSVLLCTLDKGRLTWSTRMPAPAADIVLSDQGNVLPAPLRAATTRWLDEVDVGLVALAATARRLEPPVGTALAQAAADVADRAAHFRLALVGAVALSQLLRSNANPLGTIPQGIAERIHLDVQRIATLPAEVTSTAHSHLPDEFIRRAFLQRVGDVAGTAFINLARSLWEDHPHLAPLTWIEKP